MPHPKARCAASALRHMRSRVGGEFGKPATPKVMSQFDFLLPTVSAMGTISLIFTISFLRSQVTELDRRAALCVSAQMWRLRHSLVEKS